MYLKNVNILHNISEFQKEGGGGSYSSKTVVPIPFIGHIPLKFFVKSLCQCPPPSFSLCKLCFFLFKKWSLIHSLTITTDLLFFNWYEINASFVTNVF